MRIFMRYLKYLMNILAKHGQIKNEFHGKTFEGTENGALESLARS